MTFVFLVVLLKVGDNAIFEQKVLFSKIKFVTIEECTVQNFSKTITLFLDDI